MRILVTGGAGFIGSNFVRRTLSDTYPGLEGAEVVVLDALTYSGNLANLAPVSDSPRYSFVHGDIRDAALLDQVLPNIDAIVHFAAESHVDRSVLDSGIFVETNVLGTQRLLDGALRHKVGRFVHVSTDEVYGSIAEGSWDEQRPLEPNSPYSASKAGSDLLARSYFRTHGLNLSITRCSNNYGPYHFPEKVIPLFVTNLIDDKHVPLYGEGNNIRDWLHVDDHTRGIALVLVKGRAGEIYNIGGGTELTNKELTEMLLTATGKDWSYVDRVQDRLGHDLRYSVDISKIQAELGYEPLVPFDQGLADVVQWYRDRRDWWEPLKQRAALMTRYLITGGHGMLGTDLGVVLADRDVTLLGRSQLDISNATAVREAIAGYDFVINAAGYTRVDDAESHEAEAALVNAVGASNLAIATADAGSLLVHVSTDYVFDGTARSPYSEDAPTRPASAYGRTKADGERRALDANPDGTFIVRTAWLYGEHGPNFAKTMLALGSARPEVSVVTDQVGQPTWTMDLARQIVALMDSDAPAGIYHGTASGQASWFEFARELFALGGLNPESVLPTDSSSFVRPAARPAYSVLGHDAWTEVGLAPMRDWRAALREAFDTGALATP